MQTSTLGWSIGVLFRAWHEAVTAALADLPHGARGHQILEFVAEGTLPTQAALAAHLGIDRTVLTYVLDDLVAAGVIERRTDATDRRVRRLAITDVGLTRLAELNERVAAAETTVLSGLTEGEQQSLRAILDRVSADIHRGDPDHDACRVVSSIIDPDQSGVAAAS